MTDPRATLETCEAVFRQIADRIADEHRNRQRLRAEMQAEPLTDDPAADLRAMADQCRAARATLGGRVAAP